MSELVTNAMVLVRPQMSYVSGWLTCLGWRTPFLPSGSMCNQIAIAVHTRPGDEIICSRESHIVFAECGGLAKLSGVMVSVIDADRGLFKADDVSRLYRRPSSFSPRTRLVVTEQTSNLGGGVDLATRSNSGGLS